MRRHGKAESDQPDLASCVQMIWNMLTKVYNIPHDLPSADTSYARLQAVQMLPEHSSQLGLMYAQGPGTGAGGCKHAPTASIRDKALCNWQTHILCASRQEATKMMS